MRVPTTEDDGGTLTPQPEDLVAHAHVAVATHRTAHLGVAAISVDVRLVSDSVGWIGDEHVGRQPLADLAAIAVIERHMLIGEIGLGHHPSPPHASRSKATNPAVRPTVRSQQ